MLYGDLGSWELPGQVGFCGWASGDNKEGGWTYLWAQCDSREVGTIWYRAYLVDGPMTDWRPMQSAEEVFAKTGYVDEERDHEENLAGAAEKLPAGRYNLDFKVEFEGDDLEFTGIKFEVAKAKKSRRSEAS